MSDVTWVAVYINLCRSGFWRMVEQSSGRHGTPSHSQPQFYWRRKKNLPAAMQKKPEIILAFNLVLSRSENILATILFVSFSVTDFDLSQPTTVSCLMKLSYLKCCIGFSTAQFVDERLQSQPKDSPMVVFGGVFLLFIFCMCVTGVFFHDRSMWNSQQTVTH